MVPADQRQFALKRAVAVAVLLIGAAAARIFWAGQARVVWGDEPFYLWLGDSLLHGQGYQFFGISGVHFSPLFPLAAGLIARFAALFGLSGPRVLDFGSLFLYVVCGAALVLPIYGSARRIGGEAVAFGAGLATAVFPALTSGIPLWGTMTEPLYLLLVASAWYFLLVAVDEDRLWPAALGGAFIGLAYLTRTEALVYMMAAPALLFVATWFSRRDRLALRRVAAHAVVALIAFAVIISPYLIALHNLTGRWQLAEEAGSTYVSAQGLATANMAAFDQATWGLDKASGEVYIFSPASEGQGLLAEVVQRPFDFLRLLRTNARDLFRTLFSPRLIHWVLLPVMALWLFARPWGSRRLRHEFILLALLAGPLSFLPFFIQDRYIAAALLPALVWIGGGAAWAGYWLARSGRNLFHREGDGDPAPIGVDAPIPFTWATVLVWLALAAYLLLQGPQEWQALQVTQSFQGGHAAAAQVLLGQGVSAESVVMSRYPAIAFHAGTRWMPTPAAAWEDVAANAQRKGADFLAIDEFEAKLRPQLAFLLDPARAPAELEYIDTVDAGQGIVVLYRFRS